MFRERANELCDALLAHQTPTCVTRAALNLIASFNQWALARQIDMERSEGDAMANRPLWLSAANKRRNTVPIVEVPAAES